MKIKIDIEKVKDLYWKRKLSLREISKRLYIGASTIRNEMVRLGIPRRPTTKREVIKPSKEELEGFYINKGLSMEKVAKNFDTSTSTICRWLKEYRIPARKFKYKKSDFSGNPKEKAYILGLVLGDLYVRKDYRQIWVELTTTHPAMANLFYSIFQKYSVPKKHIKYNKKTGRYEWRVYVLLNNSFEFMLQRDFNIDNEYFYDFLAGFFDSEGCLHVYNNHGYIGLTALIYNSNKKLLEVIKERLKRDGFHPKFSIFFKKGEKTANNYYRGIDLWAIRLHTNKEVLSLINLMPIKHKEKLNKLEIAKSININNKWEKVSYQINKLRDDIKKEVKEYISPLNTTLK